MRVNLRCFSTLANPQTCNFKDSTEYELQDGQTVGDLLQKVQIADDDVKIAFVNSKIVGHDTVLSDGDRVGLAPAVGGM